MGDEQLVEVDGVRTPPGARGRRPRRVARGIATIACVAYAVLLVVGLTSPPHQFAWEPLSCPPLAGPTGTANEVQQLRFGPQVCAVGQGRRVAMLVGLAGLAIIAARALLIDRRAANGAAPSLGRVSRAAIVTCAMVGALLPLTSVLVWHGHEVTTIGPERVRAQVAADGSLCVMFASGAWTGRDPDSGYTPGDVIDGTIRLDADGAGGFTPEGPNGATVPLDGGWPDDPRTSVACAIS